MFTVLESSLFQIFLTFSGPIDCERWVVSQSYKNHACSCVLALRSHLFVQDIHIESKLNSLGDSITMNLDNTCRCDFTPHFLSFNEPLCQDKWLILSGHIFGTSKSNSTTILKHLQLWVEKESKLVVEGASLKTLKYSSVFLQEGEQPVPPSASSSDSESAAPLLFIIPLLLVLVTVSIIVVVVCIIVLRAYKKKTHNGKLRQDYYLWYRQPCL